MLIRVNSWFLFPFDAEIILQEEVYAVVGAAMDVYNTLGTGFVEPVYQEAMEIELRRRGIPFESQKHLTLRYKDVLLVKYYEGDLVCYDQIIVELKTLSGLTNIEVGHLLTT